MLDIPGRGRVLDFISSRAFTTAALTQFLMFLERETEICEDVENSRYPKYPATMSSKPISASTDSRVDVMEQVDHANHWEVER
jgi:hypothetical protein